jgi:uncharacterized membrane protein
MPHRLALVFACTLLPGAASAGLTVCNETDATASVAIGYNDGGVWTSEGWWNVAAGDCDVVIGEALSRPFYYWRANSSRHDWEDARYMFCTTSEAFTIAGDSDCEARGYETSAFNEIALDGATRYTLTLTASAAPAAPAPAPAPEAAAPGTYGEPYSIAGILSHCDVTDTTLQCEIHSDGFRYLASSAGPTPMALLEELLAAPENSPIEIAGDMIGYHNVTADVTIRDYAFAGRDPYAAERAALQGFWTSADDPLYQLSVYGGTFEEYYESIPTSTAIMSWQEGCAGSPGDGAAVALRSYETGEFDRCMFLIEATRDRLVLAPAGAMRYLDFYRQN